MPLRFLHVCDLLSDLESHVTRRPPLLPAQLEKLYQQSIAQWFHTHKISSCSSDEEVVAILSALLPRRRTDRIYGIQAQSLSKKLRRCLSLGLGRWQLLDQWKTAGYGDLGECVERVQCQAEFPVPLPHNEVTLEEVDQTLENIAKVNRYSAPSVRASDSDIASIDVIESLKRIFQRLQSREAKWFTRIILKDYPGIEIKERTVFDCIDPRLQSAMKIQDNFKSAVDSLSALQTIESVERNQANQSQVPGGPMNTTRPRIGVKIGRPTYLKGRSIKHAVQMIAGRTMSVERKYDGEYCQIHIEVCREGSIKIFSKNGKDATNDRWRLCDSIKKSLGIGHRDCIISRNCILEGEMVVWSDAKKDILEFHHIRKHVSRSGSFLGTNSDSQYGS